MSQSDISQWYVRQYAAATGAADLEGSALFRKFVAAFPVSSRSKNNPHPLSSGLYRNISGFLRMRVGLPLGAAGYYCLTMRASLKNLEETIVGFAYWRRDSPAGPPEYVCASSTYESQDGEYRPLFMRYSDFVEICEQLGPVLAKYEEAVLERISDGGLTTGLRVVPKDPGGEITRTADELRLAVLVLALCLARDLPRAAHLDPHTNHAYLRLLARAAEWPSLSGAEGVGEPPSLVVCINPFGYGQKMVPMTLRETMQPFDCNLSVWRELLITQLASDMLMNFITPSAAMYNQWTYIEDASRGVFENRAMLERFARSETSEAVMNHLRAARHEIASSQMSNYHMNELDAHVYESLEYAQSNLILSDISILHTMEDVGKTFGSLAKAIRDGDTRISGAVATIDSAAKLVFELVYGAHCLHTKLGVAHTDMHSNNYTVYPSGRMRPDASAKFPNPGPYYTNPMAMYVAGPRGEADSYMFPVNGVTGCIIDYSRAIVGPAFQPYLAEGRPPQYAISFYRDQVNRVMRTLHRFAPDYVTIHQDALKAATISNFAAVFAAVCAVDFISIGASIAATLRDEIGRSESTEKHEFVVSEEAIVLATRLEEVGREMFITRLHSIVAHKNADPPTNPPGAEIMRAVFGRWLYSAQRVAQDAALVDVYNINNEMRYTGRDYEQYPPWGRLDEIERHLGEHKITDLFDEDVGVFLNSMVSGPRVQVIAERTRAAQEKLDGKQVSTASSWIE